MNNYNRLKKIFTELLPIKRTLIGKEVSNNNKIIKKFCNTDSIKIKSLTKFNGWKIPLEWVLNDFSLIEEKSKKVLLDNTNDFFNVFVYSAPVKTTLDYNQLTKKISYIKNLPNAIPYITTYYKQDWGICMKYNQYKKLNKKIKYKINIDSTFKKSHLEIVYKNFKSNKKARNFLFTTYNCHPNLANDNTSGIAVWALLVKYINENKLIKNNNFHFYMHPETIGAIFNIKENIKLLKNIDGGYVLTCLGGNDKLSLKPSHLSNSLIDKVNNFLIKKEKLKIKKYRFEPDGSDERQYSSQSINAPMTSFFFKKYYEYKEYHNSLDNIKNINFKNLYKMFNIYLKLIKILDKNLTFKSLQLKHEVFMEPYNLYVNLGGAYKGESKKKYLNALMFYSNGKKDLIDISELTNLNFDKLYDYSLVLEKKGLLKRVF